MGNLFKNIAEATTALATPTEAKPTKGKASTRDNPARSGSPSTAIYVPTIEGRKSDRALALKPLRPMKPPQKNIIRTVSMNASGT